LATYVSDTFGSDTITLPELLKRVQEVRPDTVQGSVINVLTTLSRKGIVRKTEGGWATITIIRK